MKNINEITAEIDKLAYNIHIFYTRKLWDWDRESKIWQDGEEGQKEIVQIFALKNILFTIKKEREKLPKI